MQKLKQIDEAEHREMREQTIQECITEIKKPENNEKEALIAGMQILVKLIGNLIKNPTEQKYRTVNLANNTIKAKVLCLSPLDKIMLMLEMMGYVKSEENPDQLVFVGNYFTVLRRGGAFIEEMINQLKLTKPLTEEDIERMQRAKEERAKAIAHKKQEEEYKQSLIEQTKNDRKEHKEFREMTKPVEFDVDKFAESVKDKARGYGDSNSQSVGSSKAKATGPKVKDSAMDAESDLVTKGDPQDEMTALI